MGDGDAGKTNLLCSSRAGCGYSLRGEPATGSGRKDPKNCPWWESSPCKSRVVVVSWGLPGRDGCKVSCSALSPVKMGFS